MQIHAHRHASLRAAFTAGLVAAMALLSACNTIQGAGKDLERGGEKVQDAARDVKEKMQRRSLVKAVTRILGPIGIPVIATAADPERLLTDG